MNAPFPDKDGGWSEDEALEHLDKLHAAWVAKHPATPIVPTVEVVPKRQDDRVLSLDKIVALCTATAFVAGAVVWLVTMSMTAERKNALITQAVAAAAGASASSDSNRVLLRQIDSRLDRKDRLDNLQTLVLCSLIKGEMSSVCTVLKNEMQTP